ncbi:hypothetical protein FRC00_013466 [Tulasnella sp. 408]|nr:hypothetical protein FRC00_013466 [Tulasnella sp. 408]
MKSNESPLVIYTDGSSEGNGTSTATCGAGVWSDEEGYSKSFSVHGEPRTNNRGELAAAVWALTNAPNNRTLEIRTDSTYVINGLSETFRKWEDEGWLNVTNKDLWQKALYEVRTRTAETKITKVLAHSGIHGNEMADELAKSGAEMPEPELLDIEVPREWNVNGAKMSSMTFALAYDWIRSSKKGPTGSTVTQNLEDIKTFFEENYNLSPKPEMIWKSIRKDCFRREITDFLWTAIHGRTQCGEAFSKWGPNWEELQYCRCGAVESLRHILTECVDGIWRFRVWNKAGKLLQDSGLFGDWHWDMVSYEDILGAGLRDFGNPAANRLYATVVSETAFSIWKVRNRERFDNIRASTRMAIDLWRGCIEKRAKTDLMRAKLRDVDTAPERKRAAEIAVAWSKIILLSENQARWILSDYG